MTELGSEDGDGFQADGLGVGHRPGTAASTDLNRPGSALSSQTRPSIRGTPSRRKMGSPGSWNTLRAGGSFGGPGGSITNSSRPASSTSRTSRTHVPSLASHAFFRPISSQRLQAQRSARPSRGHSSVSGDGMSELGSNTQRHSLMTNATGLQETTLRPEIEVPPQSRGTEYTDHDDRTTINASPEGKATLRSMGESERPLQQPMHTNVNEQSVVPAPKTSRSFSANFIRHNGAVRKEAQQRERRTSSIDNSSTFAKATSSMAPEAGINYQYFSGNTVFCWGGRLQNTRERPVNIASGILVILPSIMFLVYSYYLEICILYHLQSQQIRSLYRHLCRNGPRLFRLVPRWTFQPNIAGPAISGGHRDVTIAESATAISLASSINVNRVPFAMFIYAILATPYPACLWGYHLWLIARGETTREYLNSHKFLKKDRHRPFTYGNILKNWIAVLNRPRPPTYLRFKARYEEGDQRFGPRRGKRQAPLVAKQRNGGVELKNVDGATQR
ncbi:MAG: hypothetical protein Q9164_002727 [Protoblastenia rupestris]